MNIRVTLEHISRFLSRERVLLTCIALQEKWGFEQALKFELGTQTHTQLHDGCYMSGVLVQACTSSQKDEQSIIIN